MRFKVNSAIGSRTTAATVLVIAALGLTSGQLVAAGLAGNPNSGHEGGQSIAAVGKNAVIETAINADDSPTVFSRAAVARDALGLPTGSKRSGKHVKDTLQASEYDVVDELDSAGQVLAETQLDPAGGLISAVRLDNPTIGAKKVSAGAAGEAARRASTSAGVAVTGSSQVDEDAIQGGWNVHWDRTQDGIRVRGDETRVHVLADGRIGSVAHVEHQLAPSPANRIAIGAAKQKVQAQCSHWFSKGNSSFRIGDPGLQWVQPNSIFGTLNPSASTGAFRLAWVANVTPTGDAAGYASLVTLFIDAGDGSVIGGDVVE